MKLIQKLPPANLSSTLLRVDVNTFAELLEQTESSYLFNVNLKLAVSSGNKKLQDYEKVVITVKSKDSEYQSLTSINSNAIGPRALEKVNKPLQNNLQALKLNNGMLTPKVTDKVAKKLYSGLKIIEDLQVKEDFVERLEVTLAPIVQEVVDNQFNYTEIYSSTYKQKRKDLRKRDVEVRSNSIDSNNQISFNLSDSFSIDPTNLVHRVNSDVCDPTEPVTDPDLSTLTSESLLDNSKIRLREISKGKSPLYFDITKYYLDDILPSPNEDDMVWYEARRTTKFLDSIDINQRLHIKKSNRNQNLTFRFDLYKKGSQLVEETFSCDLYMSAHTEAFNCITRPPTVSATIAADAFNTCFLTISDKENPGKIQGYNVYVKDVTDQGTVQPYRKVDFVRNEGKITKSSFFVTSKLSIVRVIPVDYQNKESNVFTNTAVGSGHKVIGNLTILPHHFGKNGIKIDVVNLPLLATKVTLYKRDCTDNVNSKFSDIATLKIDHGTVSVSFNDSDVLIGRIYEYYVIAVPLTQDSSMEVPLFSNCALIKNIASAVVETAINVTLSEQSISKEGDDYRVSFRLKTDISKSENEKITQTLKEQVGELYDQYLNPANNKSSPLGDDTKGVPVYSNLFFHEIVRTNLNTSERETFEIVSDGVFEDRAETRQILNIKPLNPQHAYAYQVFTYKKNPIELFKKFVAWGINDKGQEWFYLPYKWKNARTKLGKLYADDSTGTPVIDAYENFTSETFGLTATHQVDVLREYAEITQVIASRVDRNTVKINWSFSSYDNNMYDSFVVMKVVNGIRSFVGRTHKSFIYHELDASSLGTVYYIVVPIMQNFDIDKSEYSNHLLISPEGITEKKVITFTRNKNFNEMSVSTNKVVDQVSKVVTKIPSKFRSPL